MTRSCRQRRLSRHEPIQCMCYTGRLHWADVVLCHFLWRCQLSEEDWEVAEVSCISIHNEEVMTISCGWTWTQHIMTTPPLAFFFWHFWKRKTIQWMHSHVTFNRKACYPTFTHEITLWSSYWDVYCFNIVFFGRHFVVRWNHAWQMICLFLCL